MTRALRLYGSIAVASFRQQFQKPGYFLSRIVTYLFFTYMFAVFWHFVLQAQSRDLGFSETDIVWYMAVSQLVMFASARIFLRIDDDVRSGNVAYTLIRPINYIGLRLAESTGATLANLLIFLPVGFIFSLLYTGVMPQGSLVFCVLFCILASMMHMLFQVMIGFTALWFYDIQPLYRVYQKFVMVLGGLYFPIAFYPGWMQTVSWSTPFGLILARPADAIYQHSGAEHWIALALMLGWLIVLTYGALYTYRVVQRTIDVHGG